MAERGKGGAVRILPSRVGIGASCSADPRVEFRRFAQERRQHMATLAVMPRTNRRMGWNVCGCPTRPRVFLLTFRCYWPGKTGTCNESGHGHFGPL